LESWFLKRVCQEGFLKSFSQKGPDWKGDPGGKGLSGIEIRWIILIWRFGR